MMMVGDDDDDDDDDGDDDDGDNDDYDDAGICVEQIWLNLVKKWAMIRNYNDDEYVDFDKYLHL